MIHQKMLLLLIKFLSFPPLMPASVVGAAPIEFDPNARRYSCSDAASSPATPLHLSTIDTTYDTVTMLLDPIGDIGAFGAGGTDKTGRMCVLSRWTATLENKTAGFGYYFPLGRSVVGVPGEAGGNDGDWTRPPGKASWQLSYVCGEAKNSGTNFAVGDYLCQVTLPKTSKQNLKNPILTDEINTPYYLTYYERNLSLRNELARFLHQNTFGPTTDELDALETAYEIILDGSFLYGGLNGTLSLSGNETSSSSRSLLSHNEAMTKLQVEWVAAQMDPSTFTSGKFTSHREYWRKRLNPRRWETYRIGEAGPAPCELHSRWRKFAFTDYDVQNSRALRWGNMDLGGAYQTAPGHRVTVETVMLENVPSLQPSVSLAPSWSSAPSSLPTFPVPTRSPIAAATASPTISLAPSVHSIVGFGDMEDALDTQIINAWPGRVSTAIVRLNPNITDPALDPNTPFVHSGLASLEIAGGGFIFRQLGVGCPSARLSEPINAGDVLRISFWVNMKAPNKILEVSTGHYHSKKPKGWAIVEDDSHMIIRTRITNATEWTRIEAIHIVGDDWTWNGELLPPVSCNDYQLRISPDGSETGYYIDDFRVEKVLNLAERVVQRGFLKNPDFALSFQYWKALTGISGDTVYDPDQRKEVARLRRGRRLMQNIVERTIPGDTYKFRFWAKLWGTQSVPVNIVLRMRFENDDIVNGPCKKSVCNIFIRALATTIETNERKWQQIVSNDFTIPDFTKWPGRPTFILFTMFTLDMATTGELLVSNFQFMGKHSLPGEVFTQSPTVTNVPSYQPSTMKRDNVAYIVRYAGDFRTVINYPFQIDSTGEMLPMDGSTEYQLCEVDEVEGKYGIFPNRMSFLIGGNCVRIRGGNPTVNIDLRFVNSADLHVLDLTDENATTITPINVEQTFGGDLLLESAVEDAICETFPSPYNNDYRGADPFNPQDVPSRFAPDKPVFAKLPDGSHALYDSRLIAFENSLEFPNPDGGGRSTLRSTIRARRPGFVAKVLPTDGRQEFFVFNDWNIALCNNEQPNFINRDHCVLTYDENACVKEYETETNTFVDVQVVISFDNETLAELHNVTLSSYKEADPDAGIAKRDNSRYIYAVSNLRYDDSIANGTIAGTKVELPCYRENGNPMSRWIPRPDLDASTCTNDLQEDTVAVLKNALETSIDDNPYMRDVVLWDRMTGDACNSADLLAFGMLVMTSEGCWENKHIHHMSLFDFTSYVDAHPMPSTPDTSITGFSNVGIMEYPDAHPMSYFMQVIEDKTIKPIFRNFRLSSGGGNGNTVNAAARYGDKMIVDEFAPQCGISGDRINLIAVAVDLGTMTLSNQVTTNRGGGTLVCGSPNEVAPDPHLDDYFDSLEADLECIGCQSSYINYYQQKQSVWIVNVLEAEDQLCQRMSWALYEHLNVGITTAPDNTETNIYAYDIMTRNCFGSYFDVLKEMTFNPKMGEQFNSVGSRASRQAWDESRLFVLPDENFGREIMQLFTIGLHELNQDGTEARDELGRVMQTYNNYDIMTNARVMTGLVYTARRGNVDEFFRSNKSRMDPMRIEVDSHDFYPKTSVDDNWIGDRYPLCVDLPRHHFLKIGATFRFRGGSGRPQSQYLPAHWDKNEAIRRFVLSPESSLYQQLCNPDETGSCRFRNTVSLNSNLPCYGRECRIDDIIIVQVTPGAFYEYIRQPCVHLSFYGGAKKVITGSGEWRGLAIGREHTHAMCADPRLALAERSCCGLVRTGTARLNFKFDFHGQRVSAFTNEADCAADGGQVCDPEAMSADLIENTRTIYNNPYPSRNTMFWTDASCSLSVKVREDGMVAIIHQPAKNKFFDDETVPYVDINNTITFITVPWEKDNMTFEEIFPSRHNTCGEGACVITHDNACHCEVSLSESAVFDSLPSRGDILSSLKIGALPPESFTDDAVTYSLFEVSADVEAYVASDQSGIGAISTIFKVKDEFGRIIYLKNVASSITLGGLYTMRNPPNFMQLAAPQVRDAENEVDAFLMHLIQLPSAPPFIAMNLLQLHGFSNPSPGQVERVASAFKTGTYSKGDFTFGDGKYGSLAAVSAAIALDPESVLPVLDEDPVHGQIREPLLKVIAVMRSLNFQRQPSVKLRHGLFDNMRFKIGQMVYEPPSQFSFFSQDYQPPGIFAEAGLFAPEAELLAMNAVVGLTNGFGPYLKSGFEVGDYSTSVGFLSYVPSASDVDGKIEELSTLLMAGRLSVENKQTLIAAYASFSATNGTAVADRVLMKLLTSTPEFHTTNTLRKTGASRSVTPPPKMSTTPYKAIVYVNLFGGADTFNILTPHDNGGACFLYNDYFEARGGASGIGLSMDEILPINGSSAGISGCDTFGVNRMLPAMKSIYDEAKGLFFANVGHLHKPVDKGNWMTETRTDLFSHHTMKRESHEVDAFKEGEGPGVLGRMLDILERYGEAVSATAVDTRAAIIDGNPKTGRLADIISADSLSKIYENEWLSEESQRLREHLESLYAQTEDNSGVFGDKWSQSFIDIWNKTDALKESIRGVSLKTSFSTKQDAGGLTSQLKQVARLIQIRNKRGGGINRDVFHVQQGGYDAHFDLALNFESRLPTLNLAIANFWAEMKALGMKDQVIVLIGSEFGRTINPNSNSGSDHAWAGNYFLFGGSVKGGKILGKYPTSFRDSYPYNIGQGRLIPTHSWDAIWYGISQWFGIKNVYDLEYVLPNSGNFGCDLFTDSDLFTNGTEKLKGCGGPDYSSPVTLQLHEPRYLTGEEQKAVCRLAVRSLGIALNVDPSNSRCYIVDQVITPSELVTGSYDISGTAVINFDESIPPESVGPTLVSNVMVVAAATASDFVVAGALPQSAEPSAMPSLHPTVSSQPSSAPSVSSMPSSEPSAQPSSFPSVSTMPSVEPSISSMPTSEPSSNPSNSMAPSAKPSISSMPTLSSNPTPAPTARKVFKAAFTSKDIGLVGYKGGFSYPESGLYTVQGSGADIWGNNDNFHFMYFETSGDVTFTALIENFSASKSWAKTGIMFRDSLTSSSSHYSMFLTRGEGVATQYRSCSGCYTYHAQSWLYKPSSVWLKVTKVGNVLSAYYRTTSSNTWHNFGVTLSMVNIKSTGYYVGIAVTSRTNTGLATVEVSNVQLTRVCTSESITEIQCGQANNCEWGGLSGTCYNKGTKPAWEEGYSYKGSFVATVLDTGTTIIPQYCEKYADDKMTFDVRVTMAVDGTTHKFICDRSNYLTKTPGIIAIPSHGQISIANGLRFYNPSNGPQHDPTEYKVQGRISPGSLVRNKWDNLCWEVKPSEGDEVILSACDPSNPLQLFFKTPWSAIHVRGLPGKCLDQRMDKEGSNLYFSDCHGGNNQRWSYSATTQRESNFWSKHCLDYNHNTGALWPHPCHGGSNQKFYWQEETWYAGTGTGSTLKESHLNLYCMQVNPADSYRVKAASCNPSNLSQQFYLTPDGFIKVNGSISKCLDMPLDGVKELYLGDCHGGKNQQWLYDSVEGTLKNAHDNSCASFDSGQSNYLTFKSCTGQSSQMFSLGSESFYPASWRDVASGPLPVTGSDRNEIGQKITSTYASADTSTSFVKVSFFSNTIAYSEYRVLFPNHNSTVLQFAEIELTGMVVDLPFEDLESTKGTGSDYFNIASGFPGYCRDAAGRFYDEIRPAYPGRILSDERCADWCYKFAPYPVPTSGGLVGFSYSSKSEMCWCAFEGGKMPSNLQNDPPVEFTMTPGGASGTPVYHSDLFADSESSFSFEVTEKFHCFKRDVTKVGVYMQDNLNGPRGMGSCGTESDNILSIVKNFIQMDGSFSSFTVDESIASFSDPLLSSKLASMRFFFMVDMEGSLYGWDATSQGIMKAFVQNGGTLVMTGTYGSNDVNFLNAIFGWNLSDAGCTTAQIHTDNTVGTPWEGGAATLGCPSATQHIRCNSVACNPMWGTKSSAAVVVLPHGSGRVIYLGFDYYNTGYRVNGWHKDCAAREDPWVTSALRNSLLYAKSVSGSTDESVSISK